MKKLVYLLSCLFLLSAGFVACSSESDDPPEQPSSHQNETPIDSASVEKDTTEVDSTEIRNVPNMLTGNSNWMYRNSEIRYNKGEDCAMGGSADCMYDDCRIPKEMVDGREYSVLRRVTAPAGICALDNIYQYHVREAEGKVYGLKDEYVQMMSILFGMAEDSLFIEDCGDGEVLLYDFTLKVGDRYPCKGNVKVQSVEMVMTRDSVERRMLCLSNGQKILENVGCISAGGELLGYQNTGLGYQRTYGTNDNPGIYTYGGLIYFSEIGSGTNELIRVYENGDFDTEKHFYPILEKDDEKGWHYTYKNILTGRTYQYVEYFRERAIFNWKVYTKCLEYVDRKEQVIAYLREENGKLYMYNSNLNPPEELLYDFTMEVGDEVVLEEGVMGYVVTDVSYIDFQGRELKKLTFSPWCYVEDGSKYVDYDIQDIWVEGMGSNGGLLTPFPSSLTGNWSHLDYISLPDRSTFSFADITNAKQFVVKKGKKGGPYDFSAYRTKKQSSKSVYIQIKKR